MNTKKKPRGIRNNNPLNIRLSKDKWVGRVALQSDPSFVQFVSMAYGCRAAFIILKRYIRKYGCDTIRKIITRWAPANENNTEAYIKRVSQDMMNDPDDSLSYNDQDRMVRLMMAMSKVENGGNYLNETDVRLGYELAGK